MEHALQLARRAQGLASPNPMVGCVVVRDGQIFGEGTHLYQYRDHAEILALKAAGENARGATMYVSLEPCNHKGRTGPCTEAIIAAGVRRVVAAMEDPNPLTRGKGFEALRTAGIEVEAGALEEEARGVNEAFACWIQTRQPLVTLKSALTLDGQLALPQSPGAERWISSEESRAEVHRMRHASDALITGIGTILADNPLLTDRSGLPRRRRLLRVILDSRLRLSVNSRIVKTAEDDLLVFTKMPLNSARARKLQRAGVEVVRAASRRGGVDLSAMLAELGLRDILSVLLEAGPSLNGAALSAGLVHKICLFYAPKVSGIMTAPFADIRGFNLQTVRDVRIRRFGPDFAVEAQLQDVYHTRK
jgi:diaminohydroxyphosphoribosylaminopyrimidine deaminase/5-amino-6-(5-phosphoribosylamino)uracil reductase